MCAEQEKARERDRGIFSEKSLMIEVFMLYIFTCKNKGNKCFINQKQMLSGKKNHIYYFHNEINLP